MTTEYLALAGLLAGLPEAGWDTPSLCAGWRVREVVAHMTMPVRYTTDQFMAELQASEGDFTRLSNRIASRDAALPAATLVGNLRDETMLHWIPPGGGLTGALNHVVIHGLDITVPLGDARRPPAGTLRAVLDDLTRGGIHANFGSDLSGRQLRATDLDWSFGSGTPVTGTAADLALFLCGRKLPAGRISGP
ncbi:MAG TPA: maleylpyruvate isomerase family mycothiol-dependent enzyme [Streptosporangiaceae bacterium]|nr:maleylpyruvate isomerase family mycothiol-dependent enzyme [Streptosporangiaceae bacterium]